MHTLFATPELANEQVKLKGFTKFEDTTEALASATAAVEGKLSKGLKKFIKSSIVDKGIKEELAVQDAKIGKAIQEKLGVTCLHDSSVFELMRGIRSQIDSLITGLRKEDLSAMQLGLSHSLSRYKLKFSPDKVDTMIVQAISLLDDLDKELNTYAMRVREWYGWHFPEMGKIVTDNLAYARTVKHMGMRTACAETDLSELMPEEVETDLKEAAQISMGTEISDVDLQNIRYLAEQVIAITEYRGQLFDYLKNRMNAIAPNLTVMVGELVGARLIAHSGSLINLAKHPASTVQILGAEKALFRALKTKHDTPKYGLLYHASVVGQSQPKNKGKMSRVLAAKAVLMARFDAFADEPNLEVGLEYRAKVDARHRTLEGGEAMASAFKGGSKPGPAKVEAVAPKSYSTEGDSTLGAPKAKKSKKDKSEKKSKKDKKRKAEDEPEAAADEPAKKKKKSKKEKKDKA
jgi:nucleolar protein 58